jgi:beta-alanine degradation protein BauB
MLSAKPVAAGLLAFAMSIACSSWCGATAQEAAHPVHEGPSVSIPAGKIKTFASGIKTEMGELIAGPAYGNLQEGKHGTFIHMPHGFISDPHTHTEDYFGVVIEGVGANHAPNGDIIPLPAGSYWFQRGEEVHVTQCLSKTDCLFFIVQPGKFDYVLAK